MLRAAVLLLVSQKKRAVIVFYPAGNGAEMDVTQLRKNTCEFFRDLGIFVTQKSAAHQKMDFASQGPVGVAEFNRDISGTQDDQALGEVEGAQRFGAGHMRCSGQSGDRGNSGARAGGDEYFIRRDSFANYFNGFVVDEPSGRVIKINVGVALIPGFDALGIGIHRLADERDQFCEINVEMRINMDVEFMGFLDLRGDVGRMDEHFRRDTAAVEARPAWPVLLEDGDFVSELGGRRGDLGAAAGTDHNNIIFFHLVADIIYLQKRMNILSGISNYAMGRYHLNLMPVSMSSCFLGTVAVSGSRARYQRVSTFTPGTSIRYPSQWDRSSRRAILIQTNRKARRLMTGNKKNKNQMGDLSAIRSN